MIVTVLLVLALQGAASDTDAIAKQADSAREAGKTSEAIALYQRALERRPTWKEGLWYLSGLQYSQDDFAGCRQNLGRLTELEPKGAAAWSMLGLCDYGANDYPRATEHLRQGQLLGSGGSSQIDRIAKYHLAMLLTREGAFEQALELYYALAKSGDSASQPMLEAAGLAALRRPTMLAQVPAAEHEVNRMAGKAFWDVSAGKAPEAKQDFAALVAKYPDFPNVHYFYGSYLLTNDPDQGLVEIEREIANSPQNVPALVTAAVEHLRRGEAAKALPIARDAVRYAPESYAAQTVLGRVLIETGDLKQAVGALETAAKLSPESPQPRIALASAYSKLGRTADAARERKEFLRLQELAKKPGER